MIKVFIRGGIGNQLFQLSARLLVSELQKLPLNLIYARGTKGAYANRESLKHFTINHKAIGESELV